jgi:hypothetical protein
LLSVIICTCDRSKTLAEAVDSVLSQSFPSLETIIVDNSTDPEINRGLRERYKGKKHLRYVVEPVRGLSHARNKGTAIACGRYVAFIDDDAIAAPNWAENIISAFSNLGSQAACIGGRIIPRWLAPRPDWLTDDLLGYLSIVDWGGSLRKLKRYEWIAGCNIAFDRKSLLSSGGFSTNLGRKGVGLALMSNEEIAAYQNMRRAGKIIGYAPEAVVEHQIDPKRLEPEWFLRRAAWQAVSDFIVEPEKAHKQAAIAASWLKMKLTGQHFLRLLSGKGSDHSVKAEMEKVYYLTRELLAGCPNLFENDAAEQHGFLNRFFRFR